MRVPGPEGRIECRHSGFPFSWRQVQKFCPAISASHGMGVRKEARERMLPRPGNGKRTEWRNLWPARPHLLQPILNLLASCRGGRGGHDTTLLSMLRIPPPPPPGHLIGRLKMETWGQAIPSSLGVWRPYRPQSILRVICTKAPAPPPSCLLSDAQHSSSLIPDPRIINRKEKGCPHTEGKSGQITLKKKSKQQMELRLPSSYSAHFSNHLLGAHGGPTRV